MKNKALQQGLFITIEGGDGSGKTTQIELLKNYLVQKEKQIIVTREPGGTVISEEIRKIILNKDYLNMDKATEVLLYAAARAQHVNELIIPKLKEGYIVICDRFVDSSIVYQGYGRDISIDIIKEINDFATNKLEPDLTIILDLHPNEGLKRKKSQKELDRLEMEKIDFHIKVSEGYRTLATANTKRILLLNANDSIENINNEIISKINTLL